jgi:putative alpha-1,2-mannosidase
MENQYCRVGAVTPITSGSHSVAVLQYRYENFLSKAMDANYIDTKLGEFFERKAQNIKKILEDLV